MGMAETHPWLKVELRATYTAYSIAAILRLDCAADKYTAGRATPNRPPPRGNGKIHGLHRFIHDQGIAISRYL